MKKDSSTNDEQMTPEDVVRALETRLLQVDSARAKGLEQLGRLRAAKARSLAREQTLLAIQSGPEHPRIPAAAAEFTLNEYLRRDLAAAREIAETPAPDIEPDAFIIHGFVRRRVDQTGIRGLTLALCDPQGKPARGAWLRWFDALRHPGISELNGSWVRELGYACTDQRGYFLLKAKVKAGAGSPEQKTTPAVPPPGTAGKAEHEAHAVGDAPAPSAEDAVSLELHVFNRDGRLLHVESRPVLVGPGRIDYRLIFIEDDEGGCTPPPTNSGAKKPAPAPNPKPGASEGSDRSLKPKSGPAEQPRERRFKAQRRSAATAGRPRRSDPREGLQEAGPGSAEQFRWTQADDLAQAERATAAKIVRMADVDAGVSSRTAVPTAPASQTPASPQEWRRQAARRAAQDKGARKVQPSERKVLEGSQPGTGARNEDPDGQLGKKTRRVIE